MLSVFENYRYYLLRIAQLNLDDYEIFHSQMRALSDVWSDSVPSKKKKAMQWKDAEENTTYV